TRSKRDWSSDVCSSDLIWRIYAWAVIARKSRLHVQVFGDAACLHRNVGWSKCEEREREHLLATNLAFGCIRAKADARSAVAQAQIGRASCRGRGASAAV